MRTFGWNFFKHYFLVELIVFQLFDEHGVRLEDKESLLTQPIDPRFPEAKNVTVLKEMVIFITPPQQNTELLLTRGWRLRLVGVRASDGYQVVLEKVPSEGS